MSDTAKNEALNAMFMTHIGTADGKEKIAAAGEKLIKDRLREEGFSRKILPPKTVTRADCQISVNHDTLVYLVSTEPDSRAMTMSFRGQPEVRYFTAPRFEVGFHTVGSLRYEQTQQELQAYPFAITDFIKKNIANDIQEIEDRTFLGHIESAVQSLQQDAQALTFGATYADDKAFTARNVAVNGIAELGKVKGVDVLAQTAAANDTLGCDEDLVFPIQKDDLVKLGKLFPGYGGPRNGRLKVDQLLITETDVMDVNSWTATDVGEKLVGETTLDGFKHKRLLGMKFISTIKTDILRPGNIYAFTSPEFLGGFLVLNKLEFYADKERNRFSFEAWEDISIYIGNVAAARKLELYAGSVENLAGPGTNVNTRADRLPFAEANLGQLNNLVEQNQVFPQIDQF